MAMNYKAKLSYFVAEGDAEKFVRLEIPVYAFEVDGGANRSIFVNSANDIGLTSELEQARAFKNIILNIAKGKNFDARAVTELSEMAAKEMTLNVLFAIERYSGGKMLEGLALMDREASVYPPNTVEKNVAVEFWIPFAKLYYGKIVGTTLKNYQEI
jgi:hypothetical protein